MMKWALITKTAYGYHGRKPLREVADALRKSDKQVATGATIKKK